MTTEATTAAPARRTFLIGTARPAGLIGRKRETGELVVLLVGGALGLVLGLVLPGLFLRIVGLALPPVTTAVVVFVPYRKRSIYRWFEIDRNYRRLMRTGNARWRSSAPEAGTSLRGAERPIPEPPAIGRVRWLRADFGEGSLAVLLHLDRRSVTAVLEIEGPGVGLRDAEDQEALVDRFGAVLRHLANSDGFVRRLQLIARTVPADPQAHARDVERRGDPHAAPWLVESYDALQSMVSTSSEQHRAYLVGQMTYNRELAAEARAIAEGDDGLAVVMAREMADVAGRLAEAEIRVVGPLGTWNLAALIHSLYDPDHVIDRFDAMSPRNAWPADLDASHPLYVRSQTRESTSPEPWCHATAWIKEWPMTPVGVNFLAPLLVHTPDVIRTVAVTMDLEPTDVAIERMLTEKTNDDAESARAAKRGRTADPRDTNHTHRVDARGEDLASGAGGVNLVGYLTVSARTPDALNRDQRSIRAAAGRAFLKLEWCDREHHRAFVNTLPFATGLRR